MMIITPVVKEIPQEQRSIEDTIEEYILIKKTPNSDAKTCET